LLLDHLLWRCPNVLIHARLRRRLLPAIDLFPDNVRRFTWRAAAERRQGERG
jgi:hypothetical protein